MALNPQRKYPAPEVLNRLYWFEGLSTRQVADKLQSGKWTVWRALKYHKIPRRKPGATHRQTGQCVECSLPTCRFKHWIYAKHGYVWTQSNRCTLHHVLRVRKVKRDQARKRRGTPPSRYLPLRWRPVVSQWVRSE